MLPSEVITNLSMKDVMKLIPLAAFFGISGCAPTQIAETGKKSDTMITQTENLPSGTSEWPQTYWVKQLNLPVMNSEGVLIRTLRLQPNIAVYEVKDGWGRVDENQDHWVDLSQFTKTEPDPPLVQHEFTSRPPKVELTRPDR